jgi:hypothetical protein
LEHITKVLLTEKNTYIGTTILLNNRRARIKLGDLCPGGVKRKE